MKGKELYDKELQMFREPAREPNIEKMRFLRWLVEHDKLEHEAAGQSVGEFALEENFAVEDSTALPTKGHIFVAKMEGDIGRFDQEDADALQSFFNEKRTDVAELDTKPMDASRLAAIGFDQKKIDHLIFFKKHNSGDDEPVKEFVLLDVNNPQPREWGNDISLSINRGTPTEG